MGKGRGKQPESENSGNKAGRCRILTLLHLDASLILLFALRILFEALQMNECYVLYIHGAR